MRKAALDGVSCRGADYPYGLLLKFLGAGLPTAHQKAQPYVVAQSIGQHHLTKTRRTEVMMKGKLSPEGEVIAAYGAAMVAAFQVLINCLEENDAVLPGQFPDALGVYMEMVKSRNGDVSDMTLAVLHDIRTATLD
jgi:hypothetical protein